MKTSPYTCDLHAFLQFQNEVEQGRSKFSNGLTYILGKKLLVLVHIYATTLVYLHVYDLISFLGRYMKHSVLNQLKNVSIWSFPGILRHNAVHLCDGNYLFKNLSLSIFESIWEQFCHIWKFLDIRTDFEFCFSCHSHNDISSGYLVVLSIVTW